MPISTINNKSIADGTVIAADILDGTISSSKLVSANIAGDRIAANTLSNTVFQTGSVESYLRSQTLDFGMRNRIINGAMVIDQRNAGAAVTPTGDSYSLDRWQSRLSQSSKYTVQKDSSANTVAGFVSSLKVTSLSSYSVDASDYFAIQQPIEGFNTADLNWGTANAKTITLSFWVRSSLTGTFGGALQNDGGTYCYPFSYTINSANTWEYETITIAGPTAGSWATTNSASINLFFALGVGSTYSGTAGTWVATNRISATGATSVVGTNGATFYITGVQLEEGSVPTPFEYRQYGTELFLCQRYYEKSYEPATLPGTNGATSGISYQYVGRNVQNLYGIYHTRLRVDKRGTPTIVLYSLNGTAGQISDNDSGSNVGAAIIYYASTTGFIAVNNSGGTLTAAALGWHYTASSEL